MGHWSCHVSHVPSGSNKSFLQSTSSRVRQQKNKQNAQKWTSQSLQAMNPLQTQNPIIGLKAPTSPQPSHGSRDSQEICLALMPVPSDPQWLVCRRECPKAVLVAVLVVFSWVFVANHCCYCCLPSCLYFDIAAAVFCSFRRCCCCAI